MSDQGLKIFYLSIILGFAVWRIISSFKNTDAPTTLAKRWLASLILVFLWVILCRAFLSAGGLAAGFGAPIATLAICVALSTIWASEWGAMLAAPITSMFGGGPATHREVPLYAIAEARRKRGFYHEAIEEIEKQLNKFPGDLNGTLLLVDVYAKDLKQLGPAHAAVESYLAQGPHHPKNTFLALSHLAEAYISQEENRERAQACWERIQVLCEGTEQEIIAAQRLAHLGSAEHLAERKAPRRIQLKEYDRRVGLRSTAPAIKAPEISPADLANEYITQLEAHPLDLESREKLALLYADHYQRLDMAIDQLETMVQFRNQSPKNVVRWLNLMADCHIKLAGNVGDARACLERIGKLFPGSAHATQAEKRIHLLNLEKKGRHS